MTTLYAVVQTVGGFAREDAPQARCVGVYADKLVADQVKCLAGSGASVQPIELDVVPPGFVQSAQHFGIEFGKPRC